MRRKSTRTRVGGVPGDQDERLELARLSEERVVVQEAGLGVGAVAALVEELAGDVRPEPVREVAASVEGHAEGALAAELQAELVPVGVGEVVDVLRAQGVETGQLDVLREDRPVGDEVRVDARVWLDVRVGGTEQLAGVLDGPRLDDVDDLAARVEAVADGALGVLVGEPVPHGEERGHRGVVLGRDELQLAPLVRELSTDSSGDHGVDGLDDRERAAVGVVGGSGDVVRRAGHAGLLERAAEGRS